LPLHSACHGRLGIILLTINFFLLLLYSVRSSRPHLHMSYITDYVYSRRLDIRT
jgi:hypothetical protein